MLDHRSSFAPDQLFHALADATRLAIIERLTRSEAVVSELAAPLAMSLAAAVQHVQILEAAGLIRTQKAGRVRICSLDGEMLGRVERWLAQRRHSWESRAHGGGDGPADAGRGGGGAKAGRKRKKAP